MGNDGGSIPTRRELVKEAARNPSAIQVKESQLAQQQYHWTVDPISQQPLAPPIVSDGNGQLYNKDTILEFLVEGTHKGDAEKVTQGLVKSLKDVVEVKFEVADPASKTTNGTHPGEAWVCPVTGDKLGPGSKAVYLVPCGHAFSGQAIKEVLGEKCLTCETQYASNDIIPIIPTSTTDIARLSLRLKTLQEKGLSHSLKKASGGKKRKKRDEAVEVATAEIGKTNGASNTSSSTTINNVTTASITAKVLEEQEKAKKRRAGNENVQSLFSSRDQTKPHGKSSDFMSRGYSLPTGAKG